MTAGVNTNSIFSTSPVKKPPQGPIDERAKEYAPPVCGNAGDISATLCVKPIYIMAMMMVAKNIPPHPPEARPRFHPEKCPDITAPTPRAQSDQTPACRFNSRDSKYDLSFF